MARIVQFSSILLMVAISLATATSDSFNFTFVENESAHFSVGRIVVTNGDSFVFDDGTGICERFFTITSMGEIQTNGVVDREAVVNATFDHTDVINCPVQYMQDGTIRSPVVRLTVLDLNDEVPRFFDFLTAVHELDVSELSVIGQPIKYLAPYDQDKGPNGTVQFSITSGNELGFFRLDFAMGDPSTSQNRMVYLNRTLDRESKATYNLTLSLSDMGSPPLTAEQYLVIKVVDADDEAPTFASSSLMFDILETHPVGVDHPFGNVSAIDSDEFNSFFYFIDDSSIQDDADQYFTVNSLNGQLFLLKPLDYEDSTISRTFQFIVKAGDPKSPHTGSVTIDINVLDTNSKPPELINTNALTQSVMENTAFINFQMVFNDKDLNPMDSGISSSDVTFTPIEVTQYQFKNKSISSNYWLLSLNITQSFNREETPFIIATLTVSDSGSPPLSTTINITIEILDENDNAPQFTGELQGVVSESTPLRHTVLNIHASDADNGTNGTFTFSIANTEPQVASELFDLTQDGVLKLAQVPSLGSVYSQVKIDVMATDLGNPPLSTTAQVNITIVPSITFPPLSFQTYTGYDLFQQHTIYLEVKTGKNNGLILYQRSSQGGNNFRAVEIINSQVYYSVGEEKYTNQLNLELDTWYSIFIDETRNDVVDVWRRGSRTIGVVGAAEIQRCSSKVTSGPTEPLSLGGLSNIFSIPTGQITARDFVGCIGAVIISNQQLDISCPATSQGTLRGCRQHGSCSEECTGQSSCVKYTLEPYCKCNGGFTGEACAPTTGNTGININRSTSVQFSLGYDFFFDLQASNQQPIGAAAAQTGNVLQTVLISLVPRSENLTGTIFYSRTVKTIHILEVQDTLRYTVYDNNYKAHLFLDTEQIPLQIGLQNEITLIITSSQVQVNHSVNGESRILKARTESNNRNVSQSFLFAEQPYTTISLGGTSDQDAESVVGDFVGCINSLTIDNVNIPIDGLLASRQNNFTIIGPENGVNKGCHPCFMGGCRANEECKINGPVSDNMHSCVCVRDCSIPTTTMRFPEPSVNGVSPAIKLSYIIAIAASIILISAVALVIFTIICHVLCKCSKRKSRGTATITSPSINTAIHPQQSNDTPKTMEAAQDALAESRRKNDYVTHILPPNKHPIIQQLLAMDPSGTVSPGSFRSRSASEETGFQTASEQGDSRRNSNREVDSDYSNFDTDSEDYTGTSGIIEAMTPAELQLASSGSMLGVPVQYGRHPHPLTSRERIALIPIRPNSDLLSETDTELSSTIVDRDRDSNVSDPNFPKWYKSSSPSTIVDGENNTSQGLQNTAVYKQQQRSKKNLKHHPRQVKSTSPLYHPHYTHHQPLSGSPLVHSQRFNFPAVSPLEHQNRVTIGDQHYPLHTYQQLHNPAHIRQYSEQSYMEAVAPIHIRGISDTPYYPGYQGTSLTPSTHEMPQYRDLNSFAQVNPITYWEQQTRMRPNIDPEDLHLLSGPCVPFEDVSTEPSVIESTVVGDETQSQSQSIIYMPSAQAPDINTRMTMSGRLLPQVSNRAMPYSTPYMVQEGYNQNRTNQFVSQGTAETNLSSAAEYSQPFQSQQRPALTRVDNTHIPSAENDRTHSSNTIVGTQETPLVNTQLRASFNQGPESQQPLVS